MFIYGDENCINFLEIDARYSKNFNNLTQESLNELYKEKSGSFYHRRVIQRFNTDDELHCTILDH